MALPIYSKIINKLARETLKPLGVVRKGQSRTWLDDHGWWVTIVEFQPSNWDKGSYLNVGINWQWYPQDHISFDLGYRESSFVKFENEEQFLVDAKELVDLAKERILEYREELKTPDKARSYILTNTEGDDRHIWSSLNKGMACLVTGSPDLAFEYLEKAISCSDDREWAMDVKEYAKKFTSLEPQEQLVFLENTIKESRKLKKFKEVEVVLGESA